MIESHLHISTILIFSFRTTRASFSPFCISFVFFYNLKQFFWYFILSVKYWNRLKMAWPDSPANKSVWTWLVPIIPLAPPRRDGERRLGDESASGQYFNATLVYGYVYIHFQSFICDICAKRTPLHCSSQDRVVTSKLVDVSVVMNNNLKLGISWVERFCLTQQLQKAFLLTTLCYSSL